MIYHIYTDRIKVESSTKNGMIKKFFNKKKKRFLSTRKIATKYSLYADYKNFFFGLILFWNSQVDTDTQYVSLVIL